MPSNASPKSTFEPLLSLTDLAGFLNTTRRTIERMRAAGKLPPADIKVGKMPRWQAATIRAWLAGQGPLS